MQRVVVPRSPKPWPRTAVHPALYMHWKKKMFPAPEKAHELVVEKQREEFAT